MLSIDTIEIARKNGVIGRRVILFQSTASTNDMAWLHANNPANHGLCILAESQSQGRGRRSRPWFCQPGQSILCSILLLGQTIPAETLTLLTAVAIVEAIQTACHLPCRIKWPNDILIHNNKLAGILVEHKTIEHQQDFVIGFGINCCQDRSFFESLEITSPATSIAAETGQSVDRNNLLCHILERTEHWLTGINTRRTLPGDVVQRWLQLSDMLGQHITVECNNKHFSGSCIGVDPAEGLILQLDEGPIRIFNAHQTSIVPA